MQKEKGVKNRKKVLTFVFWGAIIHKSLARATSRAGKLRLQLHTNSANERLWKSSKKLEKSSWQRAWKVVIYLSCAKRRAPCKLNNVMNTKHQILDSLSRSSIAWSGTTLNFFEAMIMVSIIWFEQLGCLNTILLRVWSWLRMNAGGVLNTCKSNGASLIEDSSNW